MSKYFSYDPNDGFEFHDTAEEAKAACDKSFQLYKDEASCDGWAENTSDVCWGEVRERSTLTWQIDRPPEDQLDEDKCDAEGNSWANSDFDSIQRWEIKPT